MRRNARETGFTLIEVLVAMLIGVFLLVGTGNLGLAVFRQRANHDSISAATSLAERQWEQLRDIQNPVGGSPPGTTVNANFTNGTHNATAAPLPVASTLGLNPDGTSGGQFNVTWTVSDPFPTGLVVNSQCASGMSGLKKIQINVTHTNNPTVNVTRTTYYKMC